MSSDSLECIEVNPAVSPIASIIWLHGLGADGHDFSDMSDELALPETLPVRFIFPHAPARNITINGGTLMRAWYDITDVDFEKQQDEAGILQSEDAIQQLIQHEEARGIPTDHIILAGFSQGGAIALFTGLRYKKPLGGIIALSTYLVLEDTLSQTWQPCNQKTPLFVGHGAIDPLIPLSTARKMYRWLLEHSFECAWHIYSGMPHSVCPQEIEAIREWLITHLSAKECKSRSAAASHE